jgi:hypothetical protein
MTFSTLAMIWRAMAETSAGKSRLGAATGGKVTFGFFSGCGMGISMRSTIQKSGSLPGN